MLTPVISARLNTAQKNSLWLISWICSTVSVHTSSPGNTNGQPARVGNVLDRCRTAPKRELDAGAVLLVADTVAPVKPAVTSAFFDIGGRGCQVRAVESDRRRRCRSHFQLERAADGKAGMVSSRVDQAFEVGHRSRARRRSHSGATGSPSRPGWSRPSRPGWSAA